MGDRFVPVDSTLYTTLKIGSDEYPLQIFHDNLSEYRHGFVNWHNQPYFEISLVLEGQVRVCLLEEEQVVESGDAFVIMPHQIHAIKGSKGHAAKYITVISDPKLLYGFEGSFFDSAYCKPVWEKGADWYVIPRKLESAIELLRAVCYGDHRSVTGRMEAVQTLQKLWVLLYEQLFSKGQKAAARQDPRIISMIDYLRNHYAEKFSLSELADAHHVSRGECCRYFKRMMGMTPMEYLTEYRVGISTQWLADTEMTIAEIAQSAGFGSTSRFGSMFRQKTGLTPTAYRKQAKEEWRRQKEQGGLYEESVGAGS